jgi:hypothetical protein
MTPKPDKTPMDEVDEGIAENVRRGFMVEVSPGRFSLTPAGLRHVEELIETKASRRFKKIWGYDGKAKP